MKWILCWFGYVPLSDVVAAIRRPHPPQASVWVADRIEREFGGVQGGEG